MAKSIIVKIVKNKSNGQFNISLPKKKLSKKDLFNLKNSKRIKINLEGFY